MECDPGYVGYWNFYCEQQCIFTTTIHGQGGHLANVLKRKIGSKCTVLLRLQYSALVAEWLCCLNEEELW